MTDEEAEELISILREHRIRARGYAGYFEWRGDRALEERGVLLSLSESMSAENKVPFLSPKSRGSGNDPPDCEALSLDGKRIAVEVTELVDSVAINAFKKGAVYDWADWDLESFHAGMSALILRKDGKYEKLKGGPYSGGYILVVYSDEPVLSQSVVKGFLNQRQVRPSEHIDRAFLILGYDPGIRRCPYFELW